MDWTQFSILVLAFVGLFIWNRTENRTDYRHMESMLASNRALIDAIRQDGINFQKEMMEESKSFHKRLCDIEATRK
jgi:hypothetical protein